MGGSLGTGWVWSKIIIMAAASVDYADSVDSHILTEDEDFTDVKDAVIDLLYRWESVAGALGLRPAQTKTISAAYPRDAEKCMDDAVLIWLRRAHNEKKYGPPTWRRLVQAVAARTGGDNKALAMTIAKAHPVDDPAQSAADSTVAKTTTSSFPETTTAVQPQPIPAVPLIIHGTTETEGGEVSSDEYGIKMKRFSAHESAKKCTAIEFSFGVVQVKHGQRQSDLESYVMHSQLHGVCVIINNKQFSSHTQRFGTHVDEVNLTQCFRYLGYTVEVHRNLTAHQIETVFGYYRNSNHTNFDSFIVCILSHGNDGHIFGTDSKSIELQSIVRELNAESCPSLAGKPKMFFIQACRGVDRVQGTSIASDSGVQVPDMPRASEAIRIVSDSNPITIPDDADFFFGNATPPGKVAWRDEVYGSWYVSELCRSFATLARYVDLISMVTKVHDEVGTRYQNMNYRQAPDANTRLRKKVYFFSDNSK